MLYGMSFASKIILNWDLIKCSDSSDIHNLWYNYISPFKILIVPCLYTFVIEFGPVKCIVLLNGCCWIICGLDNFKPTSGWIYHCECKHCEKECVLAGVLIVNGLVPPDPHRPWPRDTMSDSAILSASIPYFLRSFFVQNLV
jgi:hypothetical protein